MKKGNVLYIVIALSVALCIAILGPVGVMAHKDKHSPDQLKAFEEVFMEQVRIGDLLFHGDAATEKQMGTKLSNTGMACAMCHPFAVDTHPYEFPGSRSR
jgi:thiosulfate dehydrogenase